MSRKKNTTSLNISKNKNWNSSWYIYKEEYHSLLQGDIILYSYIRSQLNNLETSNIVGVRVYRINDYLILDLMLNSLSLLNKKLLSNFLTSLNLFYNKNIFLALNKLSFLDLFKNGFYIALKIAKFIEKRIKFRSKLVKLLLKKVKDNCKGIYVQCTGRINNVDMARNDKLYLGSLPLQSINLSISYGLVVANTTKGLQSIKVWICK